MKLIIPMAGRGTRVRPHSHVTPKPLLHIKGKSMVERIVDTFNSVLPAHLDEGVFILGPDFGKDVRRQLTAICERHQMRAHFVVQEVAQGTAHAVHCAAEHLHGDGIVVFADTLFVMEPGVQLEGADVVAWVKHVPDPSAYGVAVREGDRVVAFVEKPQELISTEALIGIYYVKDLALLGTEIQYLLDQDVRGPGGEFFLTDAFDRMLKAGYVFKTTSVIDWLDCGNIAALMDTTRYVLDHEQADLHQGEVVNSIVIDPVYVGPGAKVVNSVVGPYVALEAGAEVYQSVVRESVVYASAKVSHAVLTDTMIGQHAEVIGQAQVLNVGDHSVVGKR
jgi:glucose-1-phosphate thymidylyltransferase